MSWRCMAKMSWRRLEDVFWRRKAKANIFILIKMSWRRLLKTKTKDVFKTSSSRRMLAGLLLLKKKILQWAILQAEQKSIFWVAWGKNGPHIPCLSSGPGSSWVRTFWGWFWVDILTWLQIITGGHRCFSTPCNVASLIDDFTYWCCIRTWAIIIFIVATISPCWFVTKKFIFWLIWM